MTLAPIVMLPLVVTVFTGVLYRIGKDWFGWTRDQAHILMVIHEGEYWGDTLEPIYVLLNGLGLLWMLGTGMTMWWQNWQRSRRAAATALARATPASRSPSASGAGATAPTSDAQSEAKAE
ncbi:MAG: PepSY domain-containing protein [Prochlorothrix sp.]